MVYTADCVLVVRKNKVNLYTALYGRAQIELNDGTGSYIILILAFNPFNLGEYPNRRKLKS